MTEPNQDQFTLKDGFIPDEDFEESKRYAKEIILEHYEDEPSWFKSKLRVSLSKAYIAGYEKSLGYDD